VPDIEINQPTRRKKKKSKLGLRILVILVGIFIIGLSLYSLYGLLINYFVDISIVEPISWERTIDFESYSFQQEVVADSEFAGTLIPLVEEGQRVSKGIEIARLDYTYTVVSNEAVSTDTTVMVPETTEVSDYKRFFSPMAGIISFNVDGLEIITTKKDYDSLSIDLLESKLKELGYIDDSPEKSGLSSLFNKDKDDSSNSRDTEAHTKTVSVGEGLFKLTDNLSNCYLYLRAVTDIEIPVEIDDTINLRMQRDDSYISGKAKVIEVKKTENGYGFLVNLTSGLETLRHSRANQLQLVIDTQDVMTTDPKAYVEKEGEPGVYVYSQKTVIWTPIELLEKTEDRIVFTGVEEGTTVITRPVIVRDGQKLNIGS